MALRDLFRRRSEGEAAAEAAPEQPAQETERQGFLARLRQGLARSTARLTEGLGALFTKRKLDDAALEELEELLISADLGVAAARRIIDSFRRTRFGREVTQDEIRAALAEEIAAILAPVAVPLIPEPEHAPHVVLVVGVNGTGKTTTIAKLAALWKERALAAAGGGGHVPCRRGRAASRLG